MGAVSDAIVVSYLKYFHQVGNADQHLDVGTTGPEIRNLTIALNALGHRLRASEEYTAPVKQCVLKLQHDMDHENKDGVVGPGTRIRLVRALLQREDHGAGVFRKLRPTGASGFYSLFISYASFDAMLVDDIQSCLHQMGFVVKRDSTAFEFAAGTVKSAIRRTIESVDKVLTVVTDASLQRNWVTHETHVAETVGNWKVTPFSLYLKLTAQAMPEYLSEMIYIDGHGKSLRHIGAKIRAAFIGEDLPNHVQPVDLEKVIAP